MFTSSNPPCESATSATSVTGVSNLPGAATTTVLSPVSARPGLPVLWRERTPIDVPAVSPLATVGRCSHSAVPHINLLGGRGKREC